MEFELKPLLVEAVPEALKKAERYRLLNEPDEADSICRDILCVDLGGNFLLATSVRAGVQSMPLSAGDPGGVNS